MTVPMVEKLATLLDEHLEYLPGRYRETYRIGWKRTRCAIPNASFINFKTPNYTGKRQMVSWQLDCKCFITNRVDIVSTGLSTGDVTSIGDEAFAIQLPSSANKPTTKQRTRATYIS
ncbi:hypothetical protein CLF_103894 [Clonorchis sinensis]|uniref:Uncharacterized protein n=1 Tax=Clonorchis sinensis TaxID=79923 RepID=G7YAK4_CLOSI|nr:hypothetical protein CLF_103894 [Clonorchis sinensis]